MEIASAPLPSSPPASGCDVATCAGFPYRMEVRSKRLRRLDRCGLGLPREAEVGR